MSPATAVDFQQSPQNLGWPSFRQSCQSSSRLSKRLQVCICDLLCSVKSYSNLYLELSPALPFTTTTIMFVGSYGNTLNKNCKEPTKMMVLVVKGKTAQNTYSYVHLYQYLHLYLHLYLYSISISISVSKDLVLWSFVRQLRSDQVLVKQEKTLQEECVQNDYV